MDEFTTCSACSRTPLIGEPVTVMFDGRRESAVCELCLERPRSRTLGEPVRRERIRSLAGAANVRIGATPFAAEMPSPAAAAAA